MPSVLDLKLQHLEWDSNFLGFRTGQIYFDDAESFSHLEGLINQAKKDNYKLVYVFVAAGIPDTDNALRLGGKFVGSKVTLQASSHCDECISEMIHSYPPGEVSKELLDISIQSGEYSRFSLDKQLPSYAFFDLYKTWINRSVSREFADDVFVYSNPAEGMITVKLNKLNGEIGLLGVDHRSRGKGIGQKLILEAKQYVRSKGLPSIKVVTQGENVPALNLYRKCGFEEVSKYFTYHFWL